MLALRLLLELLRLCRLASAGSAGLRPPAFANRFSTSVRLMTPLSLPLMCWPGSPAAEGAGAARVGEAGVVGGCATAGVCGTEDEGEGASTIHMRWERVATSLATVCASEEKGEM